MFKESRTDALGLYEPKWHRLYVILRHFDSFATSLHSKSYENGALLLVRSVSVIL